MQTLSGGVPSAVQLRPLSVDFRSSLNTHHPHSTPPTPKSWHNVNLPAQPAIRRTMTSHPTASPTDCPAPLSNPLPLRTLPPQTALRPEARHTAPPSTDSNPDKLLTYRHRSTLTATPPLSSRPGHPTRRMPHRHAHTFASAPALSPHPVDRQHLPPRPRFQDRADEPAIHNRPTASMPARAFRRSDWSSSATAPTGALPRSAGGDGEECPSVRAFAAERAVRTAEGFYGFGKVRDPYGKRSHKTHSSDEYLRSAGKLSPSSSGARASSSATSTASASSSSCTACNTRGKPACKCISRGTYPIRPSVAPTRPTSSPSAASKAAKANANAPLGLAGVLTKRGRRSRRMLQRHFVLEGTTLSNYRTTEDVKPSWRLSVAGAHVITMERSRRIVIACGKRRVVLHAATSDETLRWADALSRAAYGGAHAEARGWHFRADIDMEVLGASSTGDRTWDGLKPSRWHG